MQCYGQTSNTSILHNGESAASENVIFSVRHQTCFGWMDNPICNMGDISQLQQNHWIFPKPNQVQHGKTDAVIKKNLHYFNMNYSEPQLPKEPCLTSSSPREILDRLLWICVLAIFFIDRILNGWILNFRKYIADRKGLQCLDTKTETGKHHAN